MEKWKVSFIILVVLVVLPWNEPIAFANQSDSKDEYVQLVVSILRSHVKALQKLTDEEIKYSDNVARHAISIKQTFDMLGPMDWHAAEAMRLQQEKKGNNDALLSQKEFNNMVENSIKHVDRLRQSAHRWMRDKDRTAFMKDLDTMMQTCHDCHAILPKNAAPAVWKGLKGKH